MSGLPVQDPSLIVCLRVLTGSTPDVVPYRVQEPGNFP